MNGDQVKILFFSDIHYTGIMPDAPERLKEIIAAAKREEADGIVCLGDTAWSKPEYQDIGDLWNGIGMPHYMVLGNHDMDRNSKAEVTAFYDMPSNYYAFDVKGLHFAALDTNYMQRRDAAGGAMEDYDHANYAGQITDCVPAQEMEWLERDLAGTDKPVVLLSHAPLCKNQDEVHYCKQYRQLHERILKHNECAGYKQVFLCCHGHSHVDSYYNWEGIHHLGINSASNLWLGTEYEGLGDNAVFSAADMEKNDCLRYVAPYRDAVYALITFDLSRQMVYVKERNSEFVGKSPVERGHSGYVCGSFAVPGTRGRALPF